MSEIVRLGRKFTQLPMSLEKMNIAKDAAFFVTLSPHEWEWTNAQQAAMAQYVLWAMQRLAAIEHIASGKELLHEKEAE